MKVLVTGAGALLGQGIIKSLRSARNEYTILAADPDARSIGHYWADQASIIPMANDPAFGKVVEDLLREQRPDAVIVGTDVELPFFAENRKRLEKEFDLHVIVSPLGVVRIADDKWLTYRFLEKNGFPHPRSARPDHAGEVERLLDEVGFPVIVKPRIGARSVGFSICRNQQELAAATKQPEGLVVQEHLGDAESEYTSGLLIFDGKVEAVVTMRRDLRDGNTYRAYVEPDAAIDPMLAKIGARLGGHGPINLQSRLVDDGPAIFEVNARFSGTTPLRALAGFNEVDAVLQRVVGGVRVPKPDVRPILALRYIEEFAVETSDYEAFLQAGRRTGRSNGRASPE